MASSFNPYHRWLGIPPEELPADFYRLMGIKPFETDPTVIEHAADRQMTHLRSLSIGPNGKLAEQLLNEVANARACLLAAEAKAQYDASLREKRGLPGAEQPAAQPRAARKAIPVARPLQAMPVQPAPQPVTPQAPPSLAGGGLQFSPTQAPSTKAGKPAPPWPMIAAGIAAVVAVVAGLALFLSQSGGKPVAAKPRQAPPAVVAPDAIRAEAPPTAPGPRVPPQNSAGPSAAVTPAAPDAVVELVPGNPTPAVVVPPPVSSATEQPTPSSPNPPALSRNSPLSPPATTPEPAQPAAAPPVAPLPPTAAPPPAAAKFPIPSAAQIKEAESQIGEVYGDRMRQANSPADHLAVAQDLEGQGRDANNSPHVRYVSLVQARESAVAAGDLSRAFQLESLIAEYFTSNPATEKAALLKRFADKSPAAKTAALAVAEAEFRALLQANNFAQAAEMGRSALLLATAARDRDAAQRITDGAGELKQREQAFLAYQASADRLRADPEHVADNLTVGRWLWFFAGEREAGLRHLAQATGSPLASAASAELAAPAAALELKTVGDLWRTAAEAEAGAPRQLLLARALECYQQSLAGLGGLEKARVEKHLAELRATLEPEQPGKAPVGETPPPIAVAKPPGKTLPTESAVAKGDWKPPQRNANTAFQSFLGVYYANRGGKQPHAAVNLVVPNQNIWTQAVKDKVRGRFDFADISYRGTASIAIPEDAVYELTLSRGVEVSINGKPTGGSGELKMVKGIHKVFMNVVWYNTHVEFAQVSLRHKTTGEEVIFFNSWKEIQIFLAAPINGQRVLEVSDWQPREGDEVKVDLKTFRASLANF